MGFVVMTNKGSLVRKVAVDAKAIEAVVEALGISKQGLSAATKSIFIYRSTKRGAKRRAKR
jgi:site-specific recombinase XerC